MTATRILVIDDEPGIRDLLSDALGPAGYDVVVSEDATRAYQLMQHRRFDLVIADVNMPRISGFDLLRKLRAGDDQTPFLFLTARTDRTDVAEGFNLGADDYVTKPFSIEEILLRVQAILRRTGSALEPDAYECGLLKMDLSRHFVTVGDQAVELSPTEFKLLKFLLEHKDKVVPKEQLLTAIWGRDFATNAAVVDTYISYLRKKVHVNGFGGVQTVRGIGFRISPES